MPYLNEARVMGNMANKPEMAMLANGVPYCYFAVRMVQKTPEGKVAEDYIRVVSYGDTATMVCRECDFGDLVLCVGRLSPKQWMTEAGREEYQLHFIAEAIQKVADGEGLMPPVTLDEAANAKASAFRSGEDELIHSDTYRFRGVRDPRPQKLYHPQPKPTGGWTLPEHYVSQESVAWMKNEEDRMRKKRETFGSLQHPPLNLSNADDRTEAHRIAATLIPWNLPRTNDGMYVRIPHSKCIPISNYIAILKAQNELLNSQPDDVRRLILDLASKRDIFLKAADDEARKDEKKQQREIAETPQETTPVATEPKRVVGSSNPNDWFESDSNL